MTFRCILPSPPPAVALWQVNTSSMQSPPITTPTASATTPRIRAFRDVFVVLWAMLGVRTDRSRGEFVAMLAGVTSTVALGFYLTGTPIATLWGQRDARPPVGAASVYLGLAAMVYYWGHPLFYAVNGHRWLREKLGSVRAYSVYSTILGIVFGNLVFGVMPFFLATGAAATPGHGFAERGLAGSDLLWLGSLALGVASTGIKAWATLCLGVDGYYYRDMFEEQPSGGDPIRHGPYRFFSDPMYSVGYFAIYAGALFAQSAPGLLVALVFHVCILLFNALLERPIFAAMYSAPTPQSDRRDATQTSEGARSC